MRAEVKTIKIMPHRALTLTSPDEVAECWSGVVGRDASGKADFTLYAALWAAMDKAQPLSCFIDIEDSGPGDALGINSVSAFWSSFSDEQRRKLNELAEINSRGGV